jgi:cold-inducible RNA-binding protein
MAKKLYVGGLPYSTTNDELKEFFGEAGTVSSANVIIDKMSGRSRGFGFVEMENDADAEKAVEMFNEKELGGRRIIVNEARPMEDRPKRTGNGGGGYNRGGGGGYNSRNF